MKKTDIRSILKEVVSESTYAEKLEDLILNRIVPMLEKGAGRDLIKPGFKDMIVKDINDKLNAFTEMDESALSPGYVTNVYSGREILEATIYKDGGVSITVRSPDGRIMKSTAALSLAELSNEDFQKYLVDLVVGLGFQIDANLQTEILSFVEKVKSKLNAYTT